MLNSDSPYMQKHIYNLWVVFCCSFALCFEGHTYMRKNYQYWAKHPHTYIQHGKVMFVWFIYDTLKKEGNILDSIYKEPSYKAYKLKKVKTNQRRFKKELEALFIVRKVTKPKRHSHNHLHKLIYLIAITKDHIIQQSTTQP